MHTHDAPLGRRDFEKMTETAGHEIRRESRNDRNRPSTFGMEWRFKKVIAKIAVP